MLIIKQLALQLYDPVKVTNISAKIIVKWARGYYQWLFMLIYSFLLIMKFKFKQSTYCHVQCDNYDSQREHLFNLIFSAII